MQKAVLNYRPKTIVEYTFKNRRPEKRFNKEFIESFNQELDLMSKIRLADDEAKWLESIPFIGPSQIEYLRGYSYNPDEVKAELIDNELHLKIKGYWENAILWEVPLMALISELYFIHCDTNWKCDLGTQERDMLKKMNVLSNCDSFADFGTRRRRSFEIQDLVVSTMKNAKNFVGTSNMYFAKKYDVKPIGTMAHEWIMGISALESLRHANRHALRIWSDVYEGRLGIALTDTFGTQSFFEDFDGYLARLFDGVRHDSGDPFVFADKVIEHYKKLGIHPMSKTIVFSDGLDPLLASKIADYVKGKIRSSFGIGTNFTNDFECSKPLNMVIKLSTVDSIPVVKISDDFTKAIGDKDALRVAEWTFLNKKLDA